MNWNRAPVLSKDHPFFPWLVLLNIIFPTALAIYSAVSTYVIDTNIQWGLAIDGALALWITTIYLLGVNSLVPIANWFANKYGYKRVYFFAIILFTLGTAASGLATNFKVLFIARLIEGIGAGLIFPIGFALIPQVFPKETVGRAVVLYIGLSFGVGIAIGLLVGGYYGMTDWRWVFLLTLPFGIMALLITWFFFYETPLKPTPPFDTLGYISFVAFVASLLVALTYGNHISMDEGWRSPLIVGLFAIALIAFLSFVIIERNSAHPFFPFALFKDFSFSMGCLTLFFIGMAIFTSATFMLTYLEEALLYDKLHTGLAIFSYGISISIFSVLGNLLTRKISPAYLGIFGLGILSLSFFLNNLLSFQSGKIMINILLILRGMGIGLSLGPMNAYSLHNVPKESITDGTTLLTFFRQVGATYGGTVLGIVLTRRQIFHDLLFAQLVNPSLPGYQYNFQALKTHLINVAGSTPIEAEKQAKFLIIQNIKTQSLIQAINDALILFGYLTLCIIIILIIYSVRNYFNKKIALSK